MRPAAVVFGAKKWFYRNDFAQSPNGTKPLERDALRRSQTQPGSGDGISGTKETFRVLYDTTTEPRERSCNESSIEERERTHTVGRLSFGRLASTTHSKWLLRQ